MPKTALNKDPKTVAKVKKVEKEANKPADDTKITKTVSTDLSIVKDKKQPNVPIMRCVGQLKFYLNDDTKKKITDFLEAHKEYDTFITDKTKEIKEITVYTDAKKTDVDGDKTESARADKRKELEVFKKDNTDLTKSFDNLNKSLYRISGPASKCLSAILHTIIQNILEYSVDVTLKKSQPGQKQPKVDKLSFGDINKDNFDIYPIISELKTLVDIQSQFQKKKVAEEEKESKDAKDKETKKKRKKATDADVLTPAATEDELAEHEDHEDHEVDDDGSDPDKKKSTTYKMVIYNIFRNIVKNRDLEEGKKLCCAVPTRTVISDILLEYVERLSHFLEILVGQTAKANTINSDHIMNANKLMFSMYGRLDKYGEFQTQVTETCKNI